MQNFTTKICDFRMSSSIIRNSQFFNTKLWFYVKKFGFLWVGELLKYQVKEEWFYNQMLRFLNQKQKHAILKTLGFNNKKSNVSVKKSF